MFIFCKIISAPYCKKKKKIFNFNYLRTSSVSTYAIKSYWSEIESIRFKLSMIKFKVITSLKYIKYYEKSELSFKEVSNLGMENRNRIQNSDYYLLIMKSPTLCMKYFFWILVVNNKMCPFHMKERLRTLFNPLNIEILPVSPQCFIAFL